MRRLVTITLLIVVLSTTVSPVAEAGSMPFPIDQRKILRRYFGVLELRIDVEPWFMWTLHLIEGQCFTVEFDTPLTTEDVLIQLAAHGYRPATARELFLFSGKYDLPQSVTALGSPVVSESDSYFPYVDTIRVGPHRGGKRIGVHVPVTGQWSAGKQFLVVAAPESPGQGLVK